MWEKFADQFVVNGDLESLPFNSSDGCTRKLSVRNNRACSPSAMSTGYERTRRTPLEAIGSEFRVDNVNSDRLGGGISSGLNGSRESDLEKGKKES